MLFASSTPAPSSVEIGGSFEASLESLPDGDNEEHASSEITGKLSKKAWEVNWKAIFPVFFFGDDEESHEKEDHEPK